MKQRVKFKRVVTGFRCLEGGCNEEAEWYIETPQEFFHWCASHAVSRMRERAFWEDRGDFLTPAAKFGISKKGR